ncbi:MAG TPA: PAS domain-containing protein [Alphaproteobacteria bacterium]
MSMVNPVLVTPPDAVGIEQLPESLRNLYAFWDRCRAGRTMPFRRDIDVLNLRPWLGNLMLIDVIDGGADYRYRVYGSVLASYFNRDLTGRCVSSLAASVQEVIHAEYGHVVRHAVPLAISRRRSVQFFSLVMARLVLPLTVTGRDVEMLLVGVYRAE